MFDLEIGEELYELYRECMLQLNEEISLEAEIYDSEGYLIY